jgi:hypothetical protein
MDILYSVDIASISNPSVSPAATITTTANHFGATCPVQIKLLQSIDESKDNDFLKKNWC